MVDPTREPDLEDQERADPEETPEYVKLEDLPYRGGGIMGRRRRAR